MQTQTVALRDLRYAALGMLGVAVVWPVLPAHPPNVCPLRSLTGIPCPFCGMTRAVVAAVHGDLVASLRFNPAGVLLVALAIAMVIGWRAQRVRLPAWLVPAAFALLWTYNLTLNPTFH
ncbi:MAG: hypothetical protein JWL83_2195 [Actinomycetia bacterium]|nr:hypothetical protein [Actinomycetes bacterium]